MSKSLFGQAVTGVAALLLCGTVVGVSASEVESPADIMAMSKAQYQRFIQSRKASAGTRRSAQLGSQLDTTGPVITKLDLVSTVDANRAGTQITYGYAASDDLSGIRWLGFVLTGPSGQQYTSYAEVGLPRNKVSGKGAMYPGLWIEAGEWRVTEVRGQDQANNDFQAPIDLEALGNLRVSIQNRRGHDATPPSLTGGKILTPSVSLSTPPKGQDYGGPLAGLSVAVADAGSAISGVDYVYAEFCLIDGGCLYMNARTNNVLGVKQTTLLPFTQADEVVNMPGVYQLRSIVVSDHAGNQRTLTSIDFGGDTDFSQWFPSTTIELKP